uniref:Nucleosome assembly protein 1-like 1 n=1 Tax=Panagrellus redivivus TaxID=6233 RepID=A0A7E4WCB5_PANRE
MKSCKISKRAARAVDSFVPEMRTRSSCDEPDGCNQQVLHFKMAAALPNLNDLMGYVEQPPFAENVAKLSKQQALYVRAAKNVEKEITQIEMEFFKKVHELESQYQGQFNALFEKRLKIVEGLTPVTEADVAEIPLIYGLEESLKVKLEGDLEDLPASKGIPKFWLRALENCPSVSDMIEEWDVPILEHLVNLEVKLTTQPLGFILKFTFTPNEFFEETVVEKTYEFSVVASEQPPHLFDGPVIDKCSVSPITWKEGKNPCFKIVKRKQKKATKGGATANRFVTKQVAQNSFFNFFNNDLSPEAAETDYEIASLIREQVIPHATLYYTGELHDNEDFDEDSFGSYEDDEDDAGSDEEN